MARRKAEVPAIDLAGTVEEKAAEFFERQKAEYEERTGRRTTYDWGVPATRTPIEAITDEPAAEAEGEE